MSAETPLPPRPLRVSGLTVTRDGRTLVQGLDFAVEPGGALLVRGPNGAGKSSLLLALAGLLRPEAGRIEIAAGDERPGEAIHFLGHLNAVKPRLTLAENLRFWLDLYGVAAVGSPSPLRGGDRGGGVRADPGLAQTGNADACASNERLDARAQRMTGPGSTPHARIPPPLSPPRRGEGDPTVIAAALETVGLGNLDHHDAGHLSQGQTRRLALARLVAIPRPVWLLDEPTAALDAGGEALVARLVRTHRAAGGVTVIATHHDLDIGPAETLALGAA